MITLSSPNIMKFCWATLFKKNIHCGWKATEFQLNLLHFVKKNIFIYIYLYIIPRLPLLAPEGKSSSIWLHKLLSPKQYFFYISKQTDQQLTSFPLNYL